MNNFGYDKNRFPNLSGQSFDCLICSCVAREPKQCHGCGNLYCAVCISDWMKKNNTCPNRCNATVTPMSSKVLIKMYNDLDIRCQFEKCKKVVKLLDLPKHESNCQRTKCWNVDICEGVEMAGNTESFPCCSVECAFLRSIMSASGDQRKVYAAIKEFIEKNGNSLVRKFSQPGGSSVVGSGPAISSVGPTGTISMRWDATRAGLGIQITQGGQSVYLKEQSYVFRTVIAEACFTSGVHYWEIVADSRTENELKIGVSLSRDFDLNSAFCDHAFGYAYYGLGQLRHNSNASGAQYGKRFKKDGVLGVCLNMNKGTLAFSLNGQFLGIAFTNDALKKGPIYPAVSLLHCAGCKIRGGQVPEFFLA